MGKLNKKILQQRADILKLFKNMSKKKKLECVKYLDSNTVHNICECLHNFFKNNFNMNERKCTYIKRKFAFHKDKIKMLLNEKTSTKKRKEILADNQIGSGLFTILSTLVLPAIISAIAAK